MADRMKDLLLVGREALMARISDLKVLQWMLLMESCAVAVGVLVVQWQGIAFTVGRYGGGSWRRGVVVTAERGRIGAQQMGLIPAATVVRGRAVGVI